MPSKPKTSKKKIANTTRRAPAGNHSKSRVAPAKSGVYICVSELQTTVSEENPKSTNACGPFASIDDARSAMLDALLSAIETAEARVTAIRRATTIEALRAAASRLPR